MRARDGAGGRAAWPATRRPTCGPSASPARTARRRRPSSSARCWRRAGCGPACSGRSARSWAGAATTPSGRRPRRSTSSATFARDARRRRRGRASWRSPRTRWRSRAPTPSTGTSRCSRTSPRTTSTSTPTWRTTSRPSGGCSPRARPRCRVVNVDDEHGLRLAAEFPDAVTVGLERPDADLRATDLRPSASGTRFRVGRPRAHACRCRGASTSSTRSARWPSARALGVGDDAIAAGAGRGRAARPGASSRSTRASPSRCSSTTRTPRTPSSTSCGPRAA